MPAKLVEKIQQLKFVDMADLLRDNLEVNRRSVDLETTQVSRNRRREIPDLLSWVSCFGSYAAVLTAKHPEISKHTVGLSDGDSVRVTEVRRQWMADIRCVLSAAGGQ